MDEKDKKIPRHPTHVVRMIDNWDGEENIITILAFEFEGQFFDMEHGDNLIHYTGDQILKTWALK